LINSSQNDIISGQICWPLMSRFFVVAANNLVKLQFGF
jgi:hypothetical protein